jgi:hypothetical protein
MNAKFFTVLITIGLLARSGASAVDDFAERCADRAAIERVYYEHRLGEKRPFEQTLPRAALEHLVREDLRKEVALKQQYGVAVTAAHLEAEVGRIEASTRAPEVFAEIKAALGGDPARLRRALARPLVVERLLHEKFENDDALHVGQRRAAEKIRDELLNLGKNRGDDVLNSRTEINRILLTSAPADTVFSENTWELGARPAEKPAAASADEIEMKKRFGPNAKFLSPPVNASGTERMFYFADLPGELQNILRIQLRQPGDVSALIETPDGFLLYLCRQRSAEHLRVAGVSLPKRDLDQWLAAIIPDTK